ncbi:hypothetical protein C0995_016485 [Termitomyces sp. Mi166|nr:hypothetical protein C0995_016485 [Termitomyces sp. Mi166\
MPPLDQSESSSSASSLSSRRIRFAPLPDPRALDDDNDDDNPDDDDDNRLLIDIPDDHKPCSLSSSPSSDVLPSPTTTTTTPQLLSHTAIATWHKPKTLNLLRPFRSTSNTSSNSLTPTPSNDSCPTPTTRSLSKEEFLTLNPFRTSWGFNFTRFSAGSPLSRTQSAQASFDSSKVRLGLPRPASLDSKAPNSPLRKGTRMLNGRVYGARKHNANPFANARDEDPEFVEWGHGGMGSVRGAQHAGITSATGGASTRWERLQSDGTFLAGAKKGVGGPSTAVNEEEEYDGSGMGWVRKRKEAREREAREREAREREAREKAEKEKEKENENPQQTEIPETTIPPTLEHNLTTVTLPHLSRHHSHRRTSSRTTSAEAVPTLTSTSTTNPQRHPRPPSEAESETETDCESRDDDDDDDDDDERVEVQRRRKTALGAGVEKVSRHHD